MKQYKMTLATGEGEKILKAGADAIDTAIDGAWNAGIKTGRQIERRKRKQPEALIEGIIKEVLTDATDYAWDKYSSSEQGPEDLKRLIAQQDLIEFIKHTFGGLR